MRKCRIGTPFDRYRLMSSLVFSLIPRSQERLIVRQHGTGKWPIPVLGYPAIYFQRIQRLAAQLGVFRRDGNEEIETNKNCSQYPFGRIRSAARIQRDGVIMWPSENGGSVGKARTLIIFATLIFAGCGPLFERPDDPPLENSHDTKIIGKWMNDSLISFVEFDGSEMTKVHCDPPICIKNISAYRTHLNLIRRDFTTTYTCDSALVNCQKSFESPVGADIFYEINANKDSLKLDGVQYYRAPGKAPNLVP